MVSSRPLGRGRRQPAHARQTHLADPVPAGTLPCGNIRPTVGITGTPVVDTSVGVLYAAAMVQPTHYELYAVDLGSGSAIWQRSVLCTRA